MTHYASINESASPTKPKHSRGSLPSLLPAAAKSGANTFCARNIHIQQHTRKNLSRKATPRTYHRDLFHPAVIYKTRKESEARMEEVNTFFFQSSFFARKRRFLFHLFVFQPNSTLVQHPPQVAFGCFKRLIARDSAKMPSLYCQLRNSPKKYFIIKRKKKSDQMLFSKACTFFLVEEETVAN